MGNDHFSLCPALEALLSLLTPHGERSPVEVEDTGSPMDDLLTPHGERSHPKKAIGLNQRRSPNPSWGTITELVRSLIRMRTLLTPHGERSLQVYCLGMLKPTIS